VQQVQAGGVVLDVLPAGNAAGQAGGRPVSGRAFRVVHVTGDPDDTGVLVDRRHDRGLGDLGAADVGGVQIRLVGQVHQVVQQQARARRERGHPAHDDPPGVTEPGHPRNQDGIRSFGIADPHPDQRVLFHEWVPRHPGRPGNPLLCRDGRALAGRVVGEPVVPADDAVAGQRALAERVPEVHTPIGQSGHGAVGGAVEDDRLVHDGPGEQPGTDLVGVGGDVPGLTWELGGQ
jgi:hypothetical protein